MEEFGRTIQLAEFPKREKKIVKKNVISMMIDIYYLIRNDRKKIKIPTVLSCKQVNLVQKISKFITTHIWNFPALFFC